MSAADAPRTWIDVCRIYGGEHAVPAPVLAALKTFAVPEDRGLVSGQGVISLGAGCPAR